MAGNKNRKSLVEQFWDTMDSMKFAVVMLLILAVVSLIGVLLPQFPPEGFKGTLETLFIQKYGAFFGSIFVFLGLDHLFTVWWYYLLLTLLCFNITVCSFNRLKRLITILRREHYLDKEQAYRGRSNHRSLELALAPAEAAGAVNRLLAENGYRVHNRDRHSEQQHLINAGKGTISRFGPFLSHIGLVIIIIGAAVSYMLSFQHFQWMGQNEQIVVPDLNYMSSPAYRFENTTARILQVFGLSRDPSNMMQADSVIRRSDWRRLPENPGLKKSFSVRLDKFNAQFTPQGKPKAYLSTVTVLGPEDQAEPLFSQLIKVNDPLIYKGVYFYQTSYSASGRAAEWIELTVEDKNDRQQYNLKLGINQPPVPLGNSGDSVSIARFTGTFRRDKEGQVLDLPGEDRNPAVLAVISGGGKEIMRTWTFKKFPGFSHRKDDPYSVTMGDYEKGFLTGLTIRTHRSQMVIWIGFAMLVLGVLLSFYVNHRQMWAMVLPGSKEGKSRVHLAGMSYKWKQPFMDEFKGFVEKVKTLSAESSAGRE